MSLIDRIVLSVAPERGLKRVKARAAAQAIMNYDASSKGRRTYGWKAPGTGADAAAGSSRARMRNLSRDMIRNRPWAARAQAVVTNNVIGTGIMPSVTMEDPETDTEVTNILRQHLMSPAIDSYGVHTIVGLQEQVMNAVFSDGEVLVRQRIRDRRFEKKLPLLMQVQVMEADHLDETLTSYGQNEVIEGIEYGPTGRIEAYHLFDRHPGDQSYWTKGKLTSSRIPAGQILHIRRAERPGQMRGVPWLAPVMMTLGELSDYQEAQILKQRVASLLAYFIESAEDDPSYDGASIAELAPGAIVGLKPGQKATASNPPTVDGYQEFMRQGLAAIAMGVGITFESLSGDLRGVNFSSGKMGRMEMDRMVQVWQQVLIIQQFLDGMSRWLLDVWALQAKTETSMPPVPDKIDWTAQSRALIDPAKETRADLDEIKGGLTSRSRKIRERGHDPDQIAKEIKEDLTRFGRSETEEGTAI